MRIKIYLFILSLLPSIGVFGQDSITADKIKSLPTIGGVVLNCRKGKEELTFSKKDGLTERWINGKDTTFYFNWGDGSISFEKAKINGVKVKIFKWHNYSGVCPVQDSEIIYSSDTNRIKPIKFIYKK